MIERLSSIAPHSVVGTVLRGFLRVIPRNAVVTVRSGLNKGMKWVVGSSIHRCWLGYYEHEKQDIVERLVRPGMIVFDIGANAGFFTLAFSRLVGSAGHVYAFEPLADNATNLVRHVLLNRIENVTVVQAAVAASVGMSGFSVGKSNATGSMSDFKGYLVPMVSIDDFCTVHHIPELAVMKIDVEGGEREVLQGAKQVLSRGKTLILLALHGRDLEKQCLSLLRELRYRLFYLDGEEIGAGPLQSDEVLGIPSACLGALSVTQCFKSLGVSRV